jgi:putative ABC transport system permease protein
MLLNYLKVTFRSIVKNKLSSTINVLGLAVGLASCLLIFLHAKQELSYDQAHGKRLFRLTSTLKKKDGEVIVYGSSSVPIAPRVLADIPEITNAARLASSAFFLTNELITYKDKTYFIENGSVADTSIFHLFKFDIIEGNKQMPLPHNNAVALDKVWAEKLFGDAASAIGEMVNINALLGPSDYEVTAVFDNSSILSHLTPSYIISAQNTLWQQGFFDRFSSQWVDYSVVFTYLELTPEADPEVVNEKIHQIFLKNGLKEMEEKGLSKTMALQPVEDIHTSSGFTLDIPGKTDISLINIPIAIGALILILACFNYINLSTAQAGGRSLEVGIRKTLGVTSRGLMIQFFGESCILVFASIILGLLLAVLALPLFNTMIETPVIISLEHPLGIAIFLLVFLLVTAIIAGFYPAIYLSAYRPAEVLKGKSADSRSSNMLRKILVVLQFVISIVLISAIIVVSQQVDYLKNKDLGYNPKSKLVIPLRTKEALASYSVLKDKFASVAGVNDVTGIDYLPGSDNPFNMVLYAEGQSREDGIHAILNWVDLNYLQLMDIKLTAGIYFTDYSSGEDFASTMLINRLATEQLGISVDEAVNKVLYWDTNEEKNNKYLVSGVFENINQFSLHDEVSPLALILDNRPKNIIIDANLSDLPSLSANLEGEWRKMVDTTPFEYFTLEDHLSQLYARDYNTFRLIKFFSVISVVISCLGLYALSMFIAERRFKEIGVRKVFGASVRDILFLVSKDLSLLIIVAFIISVPISIYAMNNWLENFAYRITPGVGTYVLAGLISIIIGWLTIGYQSVRAARTNPIKVLADE